MYAALAKAVLDETHRERAGLEVRRLRERYPRASREELASRVIRHAALQCAAAGGLLAGPAAFFGAVPFGADLAYQAVTLNRMVLALAALYGAEKGGRARATGIAGGLAAGLGSEIGRQALVRVLRGALPRRSGTRTILGGLLGGAFGYAAAVAVGRYAREAFGGGRRFRLR
ncbi:MAG TPA: hypothetical protein VMN82_14660 [Thermoanaerobaculia bacterium]|nr:hypothetical protein [Thermoanaerobaculia bacterium]